MVYKVYGRFLSYNKIVVQYISIINFIWKDIYSLKRSKVNKIYFKASRCIENIILALPYIRNMLKPKRKTYINYIGEVSNSLRTSKV